MTVEARTRDYDVSPVNVGTFWMYLLPSPQTRIGYDFRRAVMSDVIGNHEGENPLDLKKIFTQNAILNGEEIRPSDGKLLSYYRNCPTIWNPLPKSALAKWANPTLSDLLSMAPLIVASTNPSRPHIGVPTFLGELRDVPGGIKGLAGALNLRNAVSSVMNFGRACIRLAAEGYISWRWAVRPMVADVRKMMNFQESCLDRFRELRRLAEGNELSRKVWLGSVDLESLNDPVPIETSRAVINTYRDTFYRKEEWAVVKYGMILSALNDYRHGRDVSAIWDQTRRTMAGITSYEVLSAAWELLPWSWFIDWFGNVGQVIAACNNHLGTYPRSICFMRHTTARSTYRLRSKNSWVNVTRWPYELEDRKLRFIVPTFGYLIPSFGLPALTGSQWSILASLAALKGINPASQPAFYRTDRCLSDGAVAIIRSYGM